MIWIIIILVAIILIVAICIGVKVYKGRVSARETRKNFNMKYVDGDDDSNEEDSDEDEEDDQVSRNWPKKKAKSRHSLDNDHSKGLDNERVRTALLLAVNSRKD